MRTCTPSLRDLRIDPVGGPDTIGMSTAIDYIRIGDEPGAPVYQTIITQQMPAAGGTTPSVTHGTGQMVYAMESKRFRLVWNDAVPGLKITERIYLDEDNPNRLHLDFTFEDPDGSGGAPRGKLNISTWYSGYWAGGDWDGTGTRSRTNITPDGLLVDPPTWVIPHEFTHTFQFVNNRGMPGSWYEPHANYVRERWIEHYESLYPGGATGLATEALRNTHFVLGDGRDLYLRWTPFLYLDTNPDNLPDLGEGTLVKIWQQSPPGQNPYEILDTIAPITGKKNVFGYMAQRGVTMNYPNRPIMRNRFSGDRLVTRSQYTDLEQRSDKVPGPFMSWWFLTLEPMGAKSR